MSDQCGITRAGLTARLFPLGDFMSHYTELKVNAKVKFEADLIASLQEMFGKDGIEVFDDAVNLGGGYDKSGAKLKAHIVIRKETLRKKLGVYGYNDVGYERLENGDYRLHVDDLDLSRERQGKVMQGYSERVAVRKAKAEGYSVKRTVEQDGTVKLSFSPTF